MIMSDVSFFYKITRENETLQNVISRKKFKEWERFFIGTEIVIMVLFLKE